MKASTEAPPHYLLDALGKRAYDIGMTHQALKLIKDDLHMGNHKEALIKVNEVMKYMETEMIPEFYKRDEGNKDGEANQG